MSETDSDARTKAQSTNSATAPPVTHDTLEPVVEKLDGILAQGYSSRQVFKDWLELILASLSQNEEQYQAIADRYADSPDRHENPLELFAAAFGELVVVSEDAGVEVLGDIYEYYRASSDNLGQFFTPHSVAAAKAEMAIATSSRESEGPTKVADPACGSGRLLIHAANHVEDGEFTGQDKDRICAMMTAVNLWLFDLDGYAIHGDSLTQDHYTIWQTVTTPNGTVVREIDPDEQDQRQEADDEETSQSYRQTTLAED